MALNRDGDNTFEIEATDAANRAPKYRLVITRDQLQPSLTYASPAESSELEQGATVKLALSFSEPLRFLRIDDKPVAKLDGAMAEYSLMVPKGEGDLQVKYEVSDLAGNVTSSTLKYKRKTKPAPPLPVIRLTGLPPADGKLYLKDSSLALRGEIDNPGEDTLELTVDGKSVAAKLTNGILSADPQLPKDKTSRVVLRYGNAKEVSFDVVQDSKDPTITPISPGAGTLLTKEKKLDITVRVEDDNLDAVLIGSREMQGAGDSTWRATGMDLPLDGPNEFVITARDRAKRENTRTLTITRDTVQPTLLAESQPAAGASFDPGAKFNARLVFDEAIAAVIVDGLEHSANGREARFSVDAPKNSGNWNLKGSARDLAGNLGAFELKLSINAPRPPEPDPTPPPPVIPFSGGNTGGASQPSVGSDAPQNWKVIEPAASGRWAKRVEEPVSKIVFVLIPAGEFMMGSPIGEPDRRAEEKPHKVILSNPYYLAETETTQAQYRTKVPRFNCEFRGDDLPVDSVTWAQAKSFATSIGCDLPTEAQWEYACRAGTTGASVFGSTIPAEKVNFNGAFPYPTGSKSGPNRKKTVEVKSLGPNPFGLYGMPGNLLEWCLDVYNENAYSSLPERDPVFTGRGDEHVLRGGSWQHSGYACRSTDREMAGAKPSTPSVIGFRCAKTLPADPK